MGSLPYLVAAVSTWAAISTALVFARGKRLRNEREQHENTRTAITRYHASLSQLNIRAKKITRELEALQRRYQHLQQATESPPSAELAIPMIIVDGLDISSEVGVLFEHVARVAKTIRHYSAYSRGHQAPEPTKARYDLHWLSDCLHSFDQFGQALALGSVGALNLACRELLSMYDAYPRDPSGYDSRDTFQRLASEVPLTGVIDAIRSIAAKTAAEQDDSIDPSAAHSSQDALVSPDLPRPAL